MSAPELNLETARRYLRANENGRPEEIVGFFAPEAVAHWYPHKLVPKGMTADLAAMRASSERGSKLMASQKYEVRNALADGDRVGMEIDWTGVLAMQFETIPAGGEMKAHFAMFLEFRDGKIIRQTNYDCFEPW